MPRVRHRSRNRDSLARILSIVALFLLSSASGSLAAQIWTDGDGDGLPDSNAMPVAPNASVTVGVWIDSENFAWTNYYAYVEWTPDCIQYDSASYVISGGANYPIDASSYPSGVGFSGAGYTRNGIDHIGNVELTVLTPVSCCVVPIVNPNNPYYVASSLGAGTDYRLFEVVVGTCYGEPGPLPGACCLPDGSCAFDTETECLATGGIYQGAATQCASANCQPPVTLACCIPDGSCADVESPEECLALGGAPQGEGSECQTQYCPGPTEACCLPTGYCEDFPTSYCESLGGTPQGASTACATTPCPRACCFADGICENLIIADCNAAGGLPQGPASRCEMTICPVGACCFVDGTCVDLVEADCLAQGGTHQGIGSRCEGMFCPPGACCFVDGTCQDLADADCVTAGGTYQGPGSRCDKTYCPTPLGACCLWTGGCINAEWLSCQSVGNWQGAGTICGTYECPPHTLFAREIADGSTNDVGRGVSIAVDPDGRPAMVYHDYYTGYTQFAQKRDGAWTIELVDAGAGIGTRYLDIVFDGAGRAHVTHMANSATKLQYAVKDAGAWTRETVVAPVFGVAYGNSIALMPDGSPCISYGQHWRNWKGDEFTELTFAEKQGGAWSIEVVERAPYALAGMNNSLLIDSNGDPHIISLTAAVLLYAVRRNGAWTKEAVAYAGYNFNSWPGFALDREDRPQIAYFDYVFGGLAYARRLGGEWVKELVTTAATAIVKAPLSLDRDGRPRICFAMIPATLDSAVVQYARKTASGWSIQALDATPGSGYQSLDAALDADDRLHVAYMEWVNKDVVYSRGSFDIVSDAEATGLPGEPKPSEATLAVNPNPIAGSGAWITYRGSENEIGRITVYDVQGRRVDSMVIPSAHGVKSIYWPALNSRGAPLAPGTYFLRLTTASGDQVTERVTIVK